MLTLSNSLKIAADKGLLTNNEVRTRWTQIVGNHPELHEMAVQVGLVAEVKKASVKPVLQLFVEGKVQHNLGCFLIYMLSEAAKPDVSYKKRWSLIDRTLKHVADDVRVGATPDMDDLYRSSDGMEYIMALFAQIKPLYQAEYKSCECRACSEPAKPTCKHCGGSVKSHGKARWMCKDCKRTSAR